MVSSIVFSVIIPAYNAALYIEKCIKSVETNDSAATPYEIIVVDDGSTDGTPGIVRNLGVKIVESPKDKGLSIAALRNLGAGISQGNILVFLDSDMIVPDNWLQQAHGYFSRGFEGMLGFIEKTPPEAGWVGRVWGDPRRPRRDRMMNVDFLNGRNLFINRYLFEKIHGFNESLITAEDKDLTLRVIHAGFKAVSSPEVTVVHLGYEKTLREFIKKEFWRQRYTLHLARYWGFSFRTLKNPILSFLHVIMPVAIILSAMFLPAPVTFFGILLWILPSALIAISKTGIKNPINYSLPFVFLTFLRWHVSGIALIVQVMRTVIRKGNAIDGNK